MAEKQRVERLGANVDEYLTDDGLLLLESWARDFTLEQIADKIGTTTKTLWEWRKRYPQIQKALKKGREVVDYSVENALLKSCLGYKVKEVKTIVLSSDENGNRPLRIETTEKEIAPNVTAIAVWLNNRKPDQWKRNRDNVLELKDDKSNITVNIIRQGKSDEEESWNVDTKETNSNKSNKHNTSNSSKNTNTDSKPNITNSKQSNALQSSNKSKAKKQLKLSKEEQEWLEEE